MRLLVVGLLFVVAELCEISGGYLDRCCVIGDGKGAESLCWHRTST
jgi:drug/metabolite transporter superfamily protein YnfA